MALPCLISSCLFISKKHANGQTEAPTNAPQASEAATKLPLGTERLTLTPFIQKQMSRSKEDQERYKVELARVFQAARTFRTISVSFDVEYGKDGKTWKNRGRYKLFWDKGKNCVYFEERQKQDPQNPHDKSSVDFFFNKGRQTIVAKSSYLMKDNKRKERNYATISSKETWGWPGHHFTGFFDYLSLGYSNLGEPISIIQNDSFLIAPYVTMTTHGGKSALKVEDFIEEADWPTMTLFFDAKSGLLLEKQTPSWEGRINGKWAQGEVSRLVIDEYANRNGLYFPVVLTIISPPEKGGDGVGSQIRYTVDKATLKLNEVIDESVFTPVIPPQTEVRDMIKGTTYVTPSIGNMGAEAQIAKELDELVKKAKE